MFKVTPYLIIAHSYLIQSNLLLKNTIYKVLDKECPPLKKKVRKNDLSFWLKHNCDQSCFLHLQKHV